MTNSRDRIRSVLATLNATEGRRWFHRRPGVYASADGAFELLMAVDGVACVLIAHGPLPEGFGAFMSGDGSRARWFETVDDAVREIAAIDSTE